MHKANDQVGKILLRPSHLIYVQKQSARDFQSMLLLHVFV